MSNLSFIPAAPFISVYDNNTDAYNPELWANESLAILEESMIAANLVHRDFEPLIANFGDIVNTRRPAEFTAQRKTNSDNVTIQDASATNVQVPLDQHVHVSFLIRDGEESKSFKSLVDEFLAPAMLASARFVDRVVLGQYPQFLANSYGRLGQISSSNGVDYILGTRNLLNINKAYMDSRNMILTPSTETALLAISNFTQAQDVGDDGNALREAWLGRKYGFNQYMCQNMGEVAAGNTVVLGAVNNVAGYAAGTTSLTVDGLSAALPVGSWLTIAGDDSPQRIVSSTGGATPTAMVITPGLRLAVVNDAVITRYVPGAINLGAGYAAGYSKELTVDTFTVAPRVGQLVSLAASSTSAVYTIISVTGTTGITLDRPLEAAVVDDAAVNIGPAGKYNLAFHRNAIALVVRPLAMPRAGTGALSAVVNNNGLSMRAVITYDGNKQGHLVTLDMLCGVKVLDTNLGAVMLA